MPQFDVLRTRDGQLLVDCQSDAFGYLDTRLVAPLTPVAHAPERRARLNPMFELEGEPHVMLTQFASAVHTRELGMPVTNLADHRFEIIGALDMLLTGV